METTTQQVNKKRGRPAKADRSTIKDATIAFSISADLKEIVEVKAESLDISVGQYIRGLLVRDLNGVIPTNLAGEKL